MIPEPLFCGELQAAIITQPLVVPPHTSIQTALAQMSGIQIHDPNAALDDVHIGVRSSYVLVMADAKLLGILTERDIVRLSAAQYNLHELSVAAVMTQPLISLYESEFTDIFVALNLLQRHQIRHLPLLNDRDQLVGLITQDSLQQLARPIHLLRLRTVAEVMQTQVVCACPSDSMLHVATLMAQHHISSVVITEGEQPLGILTERDIVQFQALGLNLATTASSTVMSTPLFSLLSDESLWAAHQLMEQYCIRRVIVRGAQGELLGLVTQSSVLQAFNPLELYRLSALLEAKVQQLEAEKIALLEDRSRTLEQDLQAELQARQESDSNLQRLAAALPETIYLFTLVYTATGQQSFRYLSPRAALIHELPLTTLLDDPNHIFSQMSVTMQARYARAAAHSHQTLTPFNFETLITTPSGQEKWLHITSNPERLAAGDTIWSGVVTDISQRKAAEFELSQFNHELEARVAERTHELEARQIRYQALMEGASDMILLANTAGQIIEANAQAATLLGYSQAELRTMHFTQLHDPEDLEHVQAIFVALATQRRSRATNIDFRCRDGSKLPVDVTRPLA